MARTVLVREVLSRASALLVDASPQFTRFPETDLVHWLDDAQLALAKYLPVSCSRVESIRLVPGTLQSIETVPEAMRLGDGGDVDGPAHGIQLLSIHCNMGTNGSTPGRAVRTIARDLLDSLNPMWHQDRGTAVKEFMYDPQTPLAFHVSPGVHPTTPVWVRISWCVQPARIPNTGDLYASDGDSDLAIGVHDEYAEDLVNYIVARANMCDSEWANPAKAAAFAGLFLQALNGKAAVLTGHNPNLSRLPFAPEPMGAAK